MSRVCPYRGGRPRKGERFEKLIDELEVRMTTTFKKQIERAAVKAQIPCSEYVRQAIQEKLQKDGILGD